MNQFKPVAPITIQAALRQIEGLQHQVAQFRLQTHETFECLCGDWHCYDDPDVVKCVDNPGTGNLHHCRDAGCNPCGVQAAEDYRAEQEADARRGL